jgi:hypothetical protein
VPEAVWGFLAFTTVLLDFLLVVLLLALLPLELEVVGTNMAID